MITSVLIKVLISLERFKLLTYHGRPINGVSKAGTRDTNKKIAHPAIQTIHSNSLKLSDSETSFQSQFGAGPFTLIFNIFLIIQGYRIFQQTLSSLKF